MTTQSQKHQSLAEVARLVERAVMESARYLDAAVRSGEKVQVQVKADKSLVLNLDLESQRRILNVLGSTFPVLAEEDESSHSLVTSGGSYLLVDPLDGTTSCKRFLGERGGQVGYGPLVGFVRDDVLSAAAFYSVPHRKLFTAVRGEGAYVVSFDDEWREHGARQRLSPPRCESLSEAGMLFLISHLGEARIVEFMKRENVVENLYRFGGFANDCVRLAQGFEQVQLQFNVKPWDFSAVLIAHEAGSEVVCDPLGRRIALESWRMERNNPVLLLPPNLREAFMAALDRVP